MEVWHRRAGKDIVAENMLIAESFRRPGTYWHVFPTYAQAKKATNALIAITIGQPVDSLKNRVPITR